MNGQRRVGETYITPSSGVTAVPRRPSRCGPFVVVVPILIARRNNIVKYLVIHHMDDAVVDNPLSDSDAAEINAWVTEMQAGGVYQEGSPLRPAREGATVRVRAGDVLVTDGPFAEAKEQIAGFEVLECASMEEAVKLLARHPSARLGTLEVRELWE
jgi:hypothetical protein